jgi:uncharacterized protein (UPF0332 family)
MFDWEGYLQLAEDLSKSQDNESHHRAAVSRAYYAAFNIARIYVEEIMQNRINDGNSHESVWKAFGINRPGARTSEYRIRETGFKLRDFRVSADYKAGSKQFDRTVLEAIRMARRIVADVRALRGN